MRVTATHTVVLFFSFCVAASLLGLESAAAEAGRNAPAASGIPPALKGFKGMMTGRLIKKDEMSFTFKIETIKKVWKQNAAPNPEKAIGKVIKLNLDKTAGHHRERIMNDYRGMKNGDKIELEAFDLGGSSLSVMEWLKKIEKPGGN